MQLMLFCIHNTDRFSICRFVLPLFVNSFSFITIGGPLFSNFFRILDYFRHLSLPNSKFTSQSLRAWALYNSIFLHHSNSKYPFFVNDKNFRLELIFIRGNRRSFQCICIHADNKECVTMSSLVKIKGWVKLNIISLF